MLRRWRTSGSRLASNTCTAISRESCRKGYDPAPEIPTSIAPKLTQFMAGPKGTGSAAPSRVRRRFRARAVGRTRRGVGVEPSRAGAGLPGVGGRPTVWRRVPAAGCDLVDEGQVRGGMHRAAGVERGQQELRAAVGDGPVQQAHPQRPRFVVGLPMHRRPQQAPHQPARQRLAVRGVQPGTQGRRLGAVVDPLKRQQLAQRVGHGLAALLLLEAPVKVQEVRRPLPTRHGVATTGVSKHEWRSYD